MQRETYAPKVLRQVVTAVADGAIASLEAEKICGS